MAVRDTFHGRAVPFSSQRADEKQTSDLIIMSFKSILPLLLKATLRQRWLWVLSVMGGCSLALLADPPSWWSARGVIDAGQTTNDYAAANVGQLKNIATKARDEMEANLPGGSSTDIQTLISSFSATGGGRNDFAAVNVGQAKTSAKPFYDRLIAVGYTTSYPWSDTDPARDDFAQVNVGQIKNLFSFDLIKDSNSNGLPDWWETLKFGALGVFGGSDDPDSDGVTNLEEYWLRTNPNQAADTSSAAAASVRLVLHTELN